MPLGSISLNSEEFFSRRGSVDREGEEDLSFTVTCLAEGDAFGHESVDVTGSSHFWGFTTLNLWDWRRGFFARTRREEESADRVAGVGWKGITPP